MVSRRQHLCVLVLALLCSGGQLGGSKETQGEVSGTIVLANKGFRLADIAITFEHEKQEYHARTDLSGSYSIALPPGLYTLKVYRPGLCRMRREAFIVAPGQDIRFDFELMICPSDLPGKYNYVALDAIPETEIRPLVLFGDSTTSDHTTKYNGPVIPHVEITNRSGYPSTRAGHTVLQEEHYPVVFSYNMITLRCLELSYNEQTHEVVGTGDVRAQDGKTTSTGSRARIALSGLGPTIELAP